MKEILKNDSNNQLSDEDFRDMFTDFFLLCLAVIAFLAVLCILPFALDALR